MPALHLDDGCDDDLREAGGAKPVTRSPHAAVTNAIANANEIANMNANATM